MTAVLLLALLVPAASDFVVGGRVVNGVSGQPLSRCKVYLAPVQRGNEAMVLLTGPDGRFRFEGIPAGPYELSAERNGFSRQSYGQKTLSAGAATAVVVGAEENTADLVFRLIPGAVIAGAVTDAAREPLPGMTVYPILIHGQGAQRRVRLGAPATTDDRGYFRLHSLPEGNYAVVATGTPWDSSSLDRGAAPALAYPATYSPGGTAPERANIFRVEAGTEVRADITVAAVPAVSVRGALEGRAAEAGLRLTVQAAGPFDSKLWVRSSQYVYGGQFEVEDLPPGRYTFGLWKDTDLVAVRTVDISAANRNVSLGGAPLAGVSVVVELANPEPDSTRQVVLSLVDVGANEGRHRAMERGRPTHFAGVPPGRYTIAIEDKHQWAVLSVKARGAARNGGVVEVPESGNVDVDVLADPRATEIEGKLLEAAKPRAGVLVVLAPKATWNDFTTYRFDQTNSDGSFVWRGVAAGDHLMFAFEEGGVLDYADPAVLTAHLRNGTLLRVTGEAKQNVKFELPAKPPTP